MRFLIFFILISPSFGCDHSNQDIRHSILDIPLSEGTLLSPAYFPTFFVLHDRTFLSVHQNDDQQEIVASEHAPIIALSKSIFFNRCFAYVDILQRPFLFSKYGNIIYDRDVFFNLNRDYFSYCKKASNTRSLAAFICGHYLYDNRFNIISEKKSYSFFQTAAELGDPEAAGIIDANYQYAAFKKTDPIFVHLPDVLSYWIKKTTLNDPNAYYQLHYFLSDETLDIYNKLTALKMLKKAAKSGVFSAQFKSAQILSKIHKKWGDLFVNEKLSRFYWMLAAQNVQAGSFLEHRLASFEYAKSLLEDKCYQESFDYFKVAALQNHIESQFYCGCAYANFKPFENVELNIVVNFSEALKYFKLAAANRHSDAAYLAGYFYLNGMGIVKNVGTAESYFLRAADDNHPEANYQMALLSKAANRIIFAVSYFLAAGNLKHAPAYIECGKIYANLEPYVGTSIAKKNLYFALTYFKKAADHGCAESAFYCFLIMRKHPHLESNKQERIYYLRKATDIKSKVVLENFKNITMLF